MPRNQRGGASVALPKPLTPSDAAALRRIFLFQGSNRIPDAVKAADDLTNPLLKGSMLADRFLGRYYRSTVSDLTDWLSLYRDQPEAPQIHALLLAKLPRGNLAPPRPEVPSLSPSLRPPPVANGGDADRNGLLSFDGIGKPAIDLAYQGRVAPALRLMKSYRLSNVAKARLQGQMAQALFTANEDEAALALAQESLRSVPRSDQNSLVWYIGGLAAWRLDRYDEARQLFQGGAEAVITAPYLRAATAFWASRAWRQAQDPWETIRWLKRAAEDGTTFHGLIARRLLRMDIALMPARGLLTQADVDAVAAKPAGLRAFALLQIDQPERAEAELRTLWPEIQQDAAFGRSVLLVASAGGLPDFAAQLASLLQGPAERFDALRYPVPKLRPSGGFRIDRSLIYALTRTESNFNPAAISPAGARGLMQIMPATGQYIADLSGMGAARLHEPATNLEIGQRYVAYLAALDGIAGDLIRILASYNSGPGNFQRWGAAIRDNGDPLLFIEAIPVAETRDFVPEVLSASWIYAARMREPMPSLDALAMGEFPRFGQQTAEQTVLTSSSVN
ncbi:MAG: transglycosylase SLT domain-containing protein [Proteobacteria bacterium]|nr:transglycosylase SLT domain-containing protein [Pseudomonadota bacterium]